MRLHDRSCYRQTEAAVGAELFGFRAQRMETLEHFFARIAVYTRPMIRNADFDARFVACELNFDGSPGGGKRYRIVEQIVENPFEPLRIS